MGNSEDLLRAKEIVDDIKQSIFEEIFKLFKSENIAQQKLAKITAIDINGLSNLAFLPDITTATNRKFSNPYNLNLVVGDEVWVLCPFHSTEQGFIIRNKTR